MKKCMRKLMCLALVVLLVASMTVPAMAAATTSTGAYGTIEFNWAVTCGTTTGTAEISITTGMSTVSAKATNYLRDDVNDLDDTSVGEASALRTATATADNYIRRTFEGVEYKFVSEIKKTTGTFWVGLEEVVPGVNDYPG